METEIGAPLIVRDKRFKEFTDEGRVLLEWASRVVAEREIRESDDVAAVLRWRVQRAVTPGRRAATASPPKLIVGLIAEAVSIDDAEMQRALTERQELMEQRVQVLVDEARVLV